jgi:glutamine amidotransferase
MRPPPVVVVDYQAGNLHSVEMALRHLGARFHLSERPEEVRRARRLILPGVGEARAAMSALRERGLAEAILEHRRSGWPFLGICLGCQLIFEHSEERDTPCLGLLSGTVRRFPARPGLKVPHMGWNRVEWRSAHPVLRGLKQGGYFYFVHSYYAAPARREDVLGECEYGLPFAAGVGEGSLLAFQFHPEKSGPEGLLLLQRFLGWEP